MKKLIQHYCCLAVIVATLAGMIVLGCNKREDPNPSLPVEVTTAISEQRIDYCAFEKAFNGCVENAMDDVPMAILVGKCESYAYRMSINPDYDIPEECK